MHQVSQTTPVVPVVRVRGYRVHINSPLRVSTYPNIPDLPLIPPSAPAPVQHSFNIENKYRSFPHLFPFVIDLSYGQIDYEDLVGGKNRAWWKSLFLLADTKGFFNLMQSEGKIQPVDFLDLFFCTVPARRAGVKIMFR